MTPAVAKWRENEMRRAVCRQLDWFEELCSRVPRSTEEFLEWEELNSARLRANECGLPLEEYLLTEVRIVCGTATRADLEFAERYGLRCAEHTAATAFSGRTTPEERERIKQIELDRRRAILRSAMERARLERAALARSSSEPQAVRRAPRASARRRRRAAQATSERGSPEGGDGDPDPAHPSGAAA